MAEINENLKLLRLRQDKERVAKKIEAMGWTLETDLTTTLHRQLLEKHAKYKRQADVLRKVLQDRRLASAIREFHYSKDGQEISRQLNGIPLSDLLAPPTVQYQLPERARIARLFSEVPSISHRDGIFDLRLSLVGELTRLYKLRETPRRQ